ncbi:hypothetical protein [Sporocytophaga myxococcoides]|nr:hypothetical protein [Sporocytophaga myxococcoides]
MGDVNSIKVRELNKALMEISLKGYITGMVAEGFHFMDIHFY